MYISTGDSKTDSKVDMKDRLKEWDRVSFPLPVIDLVPCPLKNPEVKVSFS